MTGREGSLKGVVVAGRYQVLEPLARGGFGAVYLAEQLATERRVALKVLWPHVLQNRKARDQFALEARVASRVGSENVVQVLDAGVDEQNDLTFLVMELLQGQTLEELVADRGPLPPALAVDYLRQTASALDKAHRYVDRDGRPTPIVHRDLKPDNLFLTAREDGTPLIKVLDFGIAKVLSASTQVSTEVKGTPLYMAYEQAANGPIGPATDIWAFGLVAFYLLTGKSYWKSASAVECSMTQLFGEVLALPLVAPSVRRQELGLDVALPSAFDAWFLRCVDRDPAQRFRSIAEAMRALSGVPVPSELAATLPSVGAHGAGGKAERPPESQTLAAAMFEARSVLGATESVTKRSWPRRLWVFALVAAVALGVAWAAWHAKVPHQVRAEGGLGESRGKSAPESAVAAPANPSAATISVAPVSSVSTALASSSVPATRSSQAPTVQPSRPRALPRARRGADDVYDER